MKEHSAINKLQQLNHIMEDIYQLQKDFNEKVDTYHLLVEEFYKNVDKQSERPLHLRIMKDKL